MITDDIKEIFWQKVQVKSPEECWEWQGAMKENGRGVIRIDGRQQQAHRVSWMINFGPIPKEMQVLHHCDNGRCVNPSHLFMGTQSDNMKDMTIKHRHPMLGVYFGTKGEKHFRSKLTNEQVLEIRAKYATGNYSQYQLANEYGVSRGAVENVIHRINWTHI